MSNPTIDEIGYVEEIRQRMRLDANDCSMDDEIENMSPFERVRIICGWYLGYNTWADTFKEYCESQGIYLTTNADDENIIRS